MKAEVVEFMVLDDLPFDFILGHETCMKWQSVLDWSNSTFAVTPGPENERIELDWNVYRGQHWRRPTMLTAKEDEMIPPHCQKVMMVDWDDRSLDGFTSKAGLVTPLRSRFIDTVMADYQHQFVLCYADDCLIYTKSESVDDHIRDIEKVFKRLEEHGVKIKASKLMLGRSRMPKNGIEPNPEKTRAISKMQSPKTLPQLRRILGIFAYYRKFIPEFSRRAAPLYEQTKKHVQSKRGKSGAIVLTPASQEAFEFLKESICKEPCILHYPDWDKPFEIHTDASTEAVAAILSQNIDGRERVIMYASKALSETEKKYQIYEQECLAVVWAAELFRKYIRNHKTLVLTDCAALQWLKTRTEGSRLMRWIMRLQEFDLEIRHRKGKDSANVDVLTRELKEGELPYRDDEQAEHL